jgi:hypothetical protein
LTNRSGIRALQHHAATIYQYAGRDRDDAIAATMNAPIVEVRGKSTD